MIFAEFEQLPELEGGKRELVDGEVITMPPPKHKHNKVSKRIFLRLTRHLGEDRVWQNGEGYRVSGGWLAPDVSVAWPHQRYEGDYAIGSPMIAVEILSPDEDLDRKLTPYFQDGAAEVWVVSEKHNTITVYVKQNDNVLRYAVDREYHSTAAGLTIVMDEIFN